MRTTTLNKLWSNINHLSALHLKLILFYVYNLPPLLHVVQGNLKNEELKETGQFETLHKFRDEQPNRRNEKIMWEVKILIGQAKLGWYK